MKKIASKAAIWLLPIATLGLVASVTLATSAPAKDHEKKPGKKVKFAHDDEIDTYLTSIRSFMLVPPRDGRFGASRVPTLHGSGRNQVPGFEKVAELNKNDYAFVSFVAGYTPKEYLKNYEQAIKNGQMKESGIPIYRMTMVHRQYPLIAQVQAQQANSSPIQSFYKDATQKVEDIEAICFKQGFESYSDTFKIAGRDSWISAKSVVASDKSCYSCHTDIKEGQPIGYVVAVLMKNTP